MFVDGMTTVRDSSVRMGCMVGFSVGEEFTRIGDLAADGRGGCGRRARQQRASTRALTAFKIAIAGAHRVLAAPRGIAIHADAHRASRFTPLGAGVGKNLVEAASLGFAFHLL